MARLEIKGLDKLEKALKANATLDDVKRVVRHNGSELQRRMQANADFSQGYQTGSIKRSITLEIEDQGFEAVIGPSPTPPNKKTGMPPMEYAPYVEYGTRFMPAQPFVRPAYEDQAEKFKSDMKKLVK